MNPLTFIFLSILLILPAAAQLYDTEEALLARVVPDLSDDINFATLPSTTGDAFQLTNSHGKVIVAGTNANARCAGLRWYLTHHCGMHFSSTGNQTTVPSPLPMPDEPIRKTPYKYRSANNHTVFSYSMAYWDWARWEKELDYLALHGINQAYLLTGHEKIWQNTLRRLNFTDTQIATWLPSVAYISWWHFDNLQGYGGPLTQTEIDNEATLARQVADRMRELGIEPITQGFYGMVPDFFKTQFPSANIIQQGKWPFQNGFERPPILAPTDPVFASTAAIYYEEMENILGPITHIGGDLFHEGGQTGGINLGQAYAAIQDGIQAHDPNAKWVMFGWTGNPRQEGLNACDPTGIIVQQTSKDLGSLTPVSGYFRDYGGSIEWTWQIIDNFGANHGLYGNLETIATIPTRFLNNALPGKFAGLGHSPEGIGTNPIQTALYYDMFWRSQDVNVTSWLDDTIPARYGKTNTPARQAWDLLARSSYRCPLQQEGITDYVFGAKPSPSRMKARTYSENTPYWAELDVVEAWKLLLQAAPELSTNKNFRHDLVDVTRHVMNFHSKNVVLKMRTAFGERKRTYFDAATAELLTLFDELDSLLASDSNFLLGTWLEGAKAKGNTPASIARNERSARNLITLWSGQQDGLDDYASRSWAGLAGTHYKSRWARYIADLQGGWNNTGTPAYTGIDLELAFLNDNTTFATTPIGNTVALAQAIFDRIHPTVSAAASLRWSQTQGFTQESKTITFDITDKLPADLESKLTLFREFGSGTPTLQQIRFLKNGSPVHTTNISLALTETSTSLVLPKQIKSPADTFNLELTILSSGDGLPANGPITLTENFVPTRTNYIGRYRYFANGSTYYRELRPDGTLKLFIDGNEFTEWNGFYWEFQNGEAHLHRADGSEFERHLLTDPQTLFFQVEPQYGPATRISVTEYFSEWITNTNLPINQRSLNDDPDLDGISNFAEFTFGTSPSSPDNALNYTHKADGSITFSWKLRKNALLEGYTSRFESSSNLKIWIPITPNNSSTSALTDYLNQDFTTPLNTPQFFRLTAQEL